jgi:N-acetyl-anhydromuramyl-L-alanine amidase AmpD
MAQSKEFPQYKWVQAKSYTKNRVSAAYPDVIFIHTTEGSEGLVSAENGAAYDARRSDGTSTHFFVDQNSTIQCVLTTDEAHAARRTGNDKGIQIEVCGKAAQSKTQWADPASRGAVNQAADVGVAIRKKYGKSRFPLRNLTPAELRAGKNGFAEHYDATKAFPSDGGDHTDPGPNFPWGLLFDLIEQKERAVTAPKPLKQHKVLALDGLSLPELKYGMKDSDYKGYWNISKMQDLLGVPVDGDYGAQTAAAVKAKVKKGDGKTVDLDDWMVIYGLSTVDPPK